jgi:hypothetical protein
MISDFSFSIILFSLAFSYKVGVEVYYLCFLRRKSEPAKGEWWFPGGRVRKRGMAMARVSKLGSCPMCGDKLEEFPFGIKISLRVNSIKAIPAVHSLSRIVACIQIGYFV